MTNGAGPIRRFDPVSVLAELDAHTGDALELITMAEQGESGGAAYVRWPDGRESVLVRQGTPLEEVRLTGEILALARERGIPVTTYERIVPLADGAVAIVQQRLPGEPPARVDADVIDSIVAVNDSFAGLLADRPDVPTPSLHLRHTGPPYLRHETLRSYSSRSRRLLQRILQIGAGAPEGLTGDDLVHTDLVPSNVLFDGGDITGVIDWGAARGDRLFGLVKLRFELEWAARYDEGDNGVQRDAIEHLDEILERRLPSSTLLVYWAHWTLKLLDWTISQHPDAVDLHLRLGESRLLHG